MERGYGMIEVSMDMRIESVANKRMHWAAKARLTKAHRQKAFNALQRDYCVPTLPVPRHGGKNGAMGLKSGSMGILENSGFGDDGVNGENMGEGITIVLTRVAPRKLDGDNLQSGFKAVRDGVAQWLGVDDGDDRLDWQYRQRNGGAKVYRVEIEII